MVYGFILPCTTLYGLSALWEFIDVNRAESSNFEILIFEDYEAWKRTNLETHENWMKYTALGYYQTFSSVASFLATYLPTIKDRSNTFRFAIGAPKLRRNQRVRNASYRSFTRQIRDINDGKWKRRREREELTNGASLVSL